MEPSVTHWAPAVALLAVGVLGGAFFLLTRRTAAAPQLDAEKEERQRRLERQMEQLRELEADQHLLTPAEYAAQKEKLEAQAAEALRARDLGLLEPASPAAPTPPPSVFLANHPQLKGALWGAGIMLFFGTLAWVLLQENRPREDRAPPMAANGPPGAAGPMGAPGPRPEDAELQALQQRLEAQPDDVEAVARAAHLLLRRQDLESAEDLTQRALSLDPFHTESRIHRALLRASRGDDPGGEADLERLSATYPHAQEALLYLGMLRLRRGDNANALTAFDRYVKEAPPSEQPPSIASTVERLRAQVQGTKP